MVAGFFVCPCAIETTKRKDRSCESRKTDIKLMSLSADLNSARQSDRAQPMGCVHWLPIRTPGRLEQILQLKGFGGGVPLNTETAAVKPRAGIE